MLADAIRDYPWSTEGNGLPVLSSAECQHNPGELKKYPPLGRKQAHVLGVMFPPPPDRLPKFSRRRGDAAPEHQAAGSRRFG